jgi:hypothetical protein
MVRTKCLKGLWKHPNKVSRQEALVFKKTRTKKGQTMPNTRSQRKPKTEQHIEPESESGSEEMEQTKINKSKWGKMVQKMKEMTDGTQKAKLLQEGLLFLKQNQHPSFLTMDAFFGVESAHDVDWKQAMRSLQPQEKRIISCFRSKIQKELAKMGCYLHAVIQPIENKDGLIWGDYGSTDIVDQYGYEILDIPYLIFELRYYLDSKMFDKIIGSICMKHNAFTAELFEVLTNLLAPLNVELRWNGTTKEAICL